jgi:hypothetical protein
MEDRRHRRFEPGTGGLASLNESHRKKEPWTTTLAELEAIKATTYRQGF